MGIKVKIEKPVEQTAPKEKDVDTLLAELKNAVSS